MRIGIGLAERQKERAPPPKDVKAPGSRGSPVLPDHRDQSCPEPVRSRDRGMLDLRPARPQREAEEKAEVRGSWQDRGREAEEGRRVRGLFLEPERGRLGVIVGGLRSLSLRQGRLHRGRHAAPPPLSLRHRGAAGHAHPLRQGRKLPRDGQGQGRRRLRQGLHSAGSDHADPIQNQGENEHEPHTATGILSIFLTRTSLFPRVVSWSKHVFVHDQDEKCLVVEIGGDTVSNISAALESTQFARPLALDLLWQVLERGQAISKSDWALVRVAIVDLRGGTFIGRLFFGDRDLGKVRQADNHFFAHFSGSLTLLPSFLFLSFRSTGIAIAGLLTVSGWRSGPSAQSLLANSCGTSRRCP